VKRSEPSNIETSNPARNFTIPLADRIRALGGAPAYVTRLRFIEDHEEKFVHKVAEAMRESPEAVALAMARIDLARLNRAIDSHNRYYPIEANLPIDMTTGLPRNRGGVFKPMQLWTEARLLDEARAGIE
jgi:hypothetical protein